MSTLTEKIYHTGEIIGKQRQTLVPTLEKGLQRIRDVVAQTRTDSESNSDQSNFWTSTSETLRIETAHRFWANLQAKKELLAASDPEHKRIKTALIVGGGAMAGAVSAEMLIALKEKDLIDAFDVIVGLSAGAANCAYTLGAKSEEYKEVYSDVLTTPNFIGHGRIRPGFLHLDFLDNLLRGDNGIDPDAIRKARPKLYVGVTNRDGAMELINVSDQTNREMFASINASSAAPYYFNSPWRVNGTPYADGYLNGLPLKILKELGYDNLLILLNEPFKLPKNLKPPVYEKLALKRAMSSYPNPVFEATLQRRRRLHDSFEPLTDPQISYDIICPERKVKHLSTKRSEVTRARRLGEKAIYEHLIRHTSIE